MNSTHLMLLGVVLFFSNLTLAEQEGTVKLYQIGKNGKYCVSTSGDEKGCISGRKDNNELVNYLDMIKNQNVEFYNLSDVVHDMRFTGANAEDMPIQRPGAEAASKTLRSADPEKQAIECTFHGAQVGVGYRVLTAEEKSAPHPGAPEMTAGRTGSGVNANSDTGGNSRSFSQVQSLSPTSLADVSSFVLAQGNPMEAEWLMKTRPELQQQFPERASALGLEKNPSGPQTKANPEWQISVSNKLPGGAKSGSSLPSGSPGVQFNDLSNQSSEALPDIASSSSNAANFLRPLDVASRSNAQGPLRGGLFYQGRALNPNNYFVSKGTLYIMAKPNHHLDGRPKDDFPKTKPSRHLASSSFELPSGLSMGAPTMRALAKTRSKTALNYNEPSSKSRALDRSWLLLVAGGLIAANALGDKKKPPAV